MPTTNPSDVLAERFMETQRQLRGLWLKLWGGGFFVVFLGFGLAWLYIEPAPPSRIVIAAGPKDGAYYPFAVEYARFCAKHGVELEVRATAGSLDNYQLLAEDDEVHLAIVQGGTAPQSALVDQVYESIGSLYLEPVWIFYRQTDKSVTDRIHDLRPLSEMRVAIGQPGSGTQAIAKTMLRENGIEPAEDRWRPVGGSEAAAQLVAGDVDAAFFVMPQTSPLIRELISNPEIQLLSLQRQLAYSRRHPYLKSLTLSQGVFDLQQNLPDRNIHLVAPAALLIATQEFHDSLVPMLLRAAEVTHRRKGDPFWESRFPSTDLIEFPLNESARLYYEQGPPFLQKYLPFWIASSVDRGKVLLLPMIALLLPLFKVAPPIYRWRIRSRIYRWYKILRRIEKNLHAGDAAEMERDHATLRAMESELDDLDSVPLAYMEEFYNLRLHVEFVERRLMRTQELSAAAASAGEPAEPDSNVLARQALAERSD